MHLTIKEIAKLAGVSKGTVSKVLNNYAGISAETKKKVSRVVAEVGYEPNSAARALAVRRTGNIGFVIPHTSEHSLSGAYWTSLITSVADEAIRSGHNLVLLLPQQEGHVGEIFATINRRKQFDGLIIGSELIDKKGLANLLYNETPFVMLGKNPEFLHYCVDIDNETAAYDITSYMVKQGYKRIAFVCGPIDYYYNRDRKHGYERALRAQRLEFLHTVALPYADRQVMFDQVRAMIAEHKPDAVLTGAGDQFMFDCLAACQEAGATVPEFGFATFDDYRYLDFTNPKITAVRQPISEMGSQAVKTLLALFNSKHLAENASIFQTTIVARKSCGE